MTQYDKSKPSSILIGLGRDSCQSTYVKNWLAEAE